MSNCSGNIWVFWNSDLSCSMKADTNQSLSISCKHGLIENYFLITAVYMLSVQERKG